MLIDCGHQRIEHPLSLSYPVNSFTQAMISPETPPSAPVYAWSGTIKGSKYQLTHQVVEYPSPGNILVQWCGRQNDGDYDVYGLLGHEY